MPIKILALANIFKVINIEISMALFFHATVKTRFPFWHLFLFDLFAATFFSYCS